MPARRHRPLISVGNGPFYLPVVISMETLDHCQLPAKHHGGKSQILHSLRTSRLRHSLPSLGPAPGDLVLPIPSVLRLQHSHLNLSLFGFIQPALLHIKDPLRTPRVSFQAWPTNLTSLSRPSTLSKG